MKKKNLEKVIGLIKEMMVANAAGGSGGFSSSADDKGPVAGFDPLIGKKKRRPTPVGRYGTRRTWKKKRES